ncbi:MAG: 16S rRNA (cytosine(1402)-N(4))-methyltransferase RsmH [Defluviitaleaceae bacterium]|nr:16S rRNA (cytosine(1402)-N(4))-methyltransferase RsmH [Defluviitaleaceae bacterium]
MEFSHTSVMTDECMDALDIRPNGIYVDCTMGGGGHSAAIAARLAGGGQLVCIDQDENAVVNAGTRLARYAERVSVVRGSFFGLRDILRGLGVGAVDGVLADLGVSSHQLDTPERGFSYMHDAPLDMRMDNTASLRADDVVNGYDEAELTRIIFAYGEERFAKRIAAQIVQRRPIHTTHELAAAIRHAIPARARDTGGHPAKRTFQALRIEVNAEIEPLAQAVEDMVMSLKPGGRVAVISFHSLEDRAVKHSFRKLEGGCTCPREFPLCICNNPRHLRTITRKPITPSPAELEANHRARSAKLRVGERTNY